MKSTVRLGFWSAPVGAIAGCGIGRGVKAQNHREFFRDSGQVRQQGADVRNGQKQNRPARERIYLDTAAIFL